MLTKLVLAALAASCSLALAQDPNESIYAAPTPAAPDAGTNQGGVRFDLDLMYLTNYVYRGVDYTKAVDPETKEKGTSNFDLYTNARISFDLGPRTIHPFLAVSANTYDSDPVSRFQEFRPQVGADLTLQPVTFTAGMQSYIYPKREEFETAEFFAKVALDDSRLWNSDKPILSPYILGAYDYEQNNGSYIEVGIRHDFVLEDLNLTLTPVARIAYTNGWQQQFSFVQENGTGWQHWDLGIEARYRLNPLLNISSRWGDWFLRAQYYHTEHLSDETVGQSGDWGGVGIRFEY